MGGSEGVGVTERGAERESAGCGVEHGVLVGVDGLGVPDPSGEGETKQLRGQKVGFYSKAEFKMLHLKLPIATWLNKGNLSDLQL